MKETMYLVTEVEFDFDDWYDRNWDSKLTFDEEAEVTQNAIGLWYAEDEDHLVDKITETTGWCIRKIDYTTNTLHPLTSYM